MVLGLSLAPLFLDAGFCQAMREGVRRDIEREKHRLIEQREARRSSPP